MRRTGSAPLPGRGSAYWAHHPAALPGINGASSGIGASLGVVLVAPFAAQATAAGYATALWISVGITAAAFIVSLFVAAPKGETV